MLMKLTAGVNFTNILRAAFTCTNPKSIKKTDGLTVFFALLGSTNGKAARKILVKSTPVGAMFVVTSRTCLFVGHNL
jgi:hypothetical protein